MKPLPLLATCLPGLEEHLAHEMKALGLSGSELVPGGVRFTGHANAIATANLELGTATRVLVELGFAEARHFGQLAERAADFAWERVLEPGQAFDVRAQLRKCKLMHSSGVEERVALGVLDRLGGIEPEEVDDDEVLPTIRVRGENDRFHMSLDTSGDPLHRRGWRLATAKGAAPRRPRVRARARLRLGSREPAPRSALRLRHDRDRSGAPAHGSGCGHPPQLCLRTLPTASPSESDRRAARGRQSSRRSTTRPRLRQRPRRRGNRSSARQRRACRAQREHQLRTPRAASIAPASRSLPKTRPGSIIRVWRAVRGTARRTSSARAPQPKAGLYYSCLARGPRVVVDRCAHCWSDSPLKRSIQPRSSTDFARTNLRASVAICSLPTISSNRTPALVFRPTVSFSTTVVGGVVSCR